MTISDKAYTFGFLFLSSVYWLAFALSVTVRKSSPVCLDREENEELRDIAKAHVPSVYLLGAVLYTLAATTFGANLDDFFEIKNISALFTQMAALSWNFAMILLALSWSEGSGRYEKLKTCLLIVYITALAGTAFCFVIQYPGPTSGTKNYILSGSATVAGAFYLLIYTTMVMFTKIVLLAICVPQIRRANERIMQTSLSLAVVGSCFLILFAFLRSTNPFSSRFGVNPYDLEPFAFLSQTIGGTLVAVGFSLPRIALLRKGVAEWAAYYRVHRILGPLVGATGRLMPTCYPLAANRRPLFLALRLRDLKISVHRDLIAIMDCGSMEKRGLIEAVALHGHNRSRKSLGSAHLDRFGAVVGVAEKYNSLRRIGMCWQEAYDAAILSLQKHEPHSIGSLSAR